MKQQLTFQTQQNVLTLTPRTYDRIGSDVFSCSRTFRTWLYCSYSFEKEVEFRGY